MVGTRFLYALTGKLPHIAPLVGAPEGSPTGLQPGEEKTVWQEDGFGLGYWKYDAYPITSFEIQDFFLYLEGRLYGLRGSQIQPELLDLAHRLTASGGQTASPARWLRDADGDFLIFIFHKKTHTLFILNDLFARLPVYYSGDSRTVVISRDIAFVWQNSQIRTFDPISLSQYMLFGFPFGERTLFQGIFSLPPATLVTIQGRQGKITFQRLCRHNLDELHSSPRGVSINAGNLVDLFRAACVNRAGAAGENVVSLSGGLDSRAAAACLKRENIPCAAASFLHHQGKNNGDVQVARQVAAHLHLPWRCFELPQPRKQEVHTLLRLKQGANNLEMSFILPFFEGLIQTFGSGLTYFTGDGGGDTLGESRPYRSIPSMDSLLRYLIERYQIFPLESAASLTGVAVADLASSLGDLMESYPEKTPARKYQRFFCLEVAVKQYNEGEDRNRNYFWSVSPFYAPHFFDYALGCPDDQKLGLRLYQQFLAMLSPGLEKISYADWGAPLGSWKFLALYAAKNLSRRRPHLTRRLKQFFQPTPPDPANLFPYGALKEQLLTSPNLVSVFHETALKKVIRNIDTLTAEQQWTLFTLTSLIEELGRGGRPGA